MEKTKKTVQIAVRLDPAMRGELEAVAAKEDRPVAAMVRILVKEALAHRRQETKKKA